MAKILLVEDDNNLREIYGERLMAEGYDIVSASDGEEALQAAVTEKPDLIISDVMMPKISGFDMLDILRQTPETKNVKIIMMTALSQAEDKSRADSLGANKYLVKSQVTLEDVTRVVHDLLGDDTEDSTTDTFTEEAVASGTMPSEPPVAVPPSQEAPVIVPEVISMVEPPTEPVEPPQPAASIQQPVQQPTATAPVSAPQTPMPVAQPVSSMPAEPAAMSTMPVTPTEPTTPVTVAPPAPQVSVDPPAAAPVAPVVSPLPVVPAEPVANAQQPVQQPTATAPVSAPQAPMPVAQPVSSMPINPISGDNNTTTPSGAVQGASQSQDAQAEDTETELNEVAEQIQQFATTPTETPQTQHQEPMHEPTQQDIIHAQNAAEEPTIVTPQAAVNNDATVPPVVPINTSNPEPASARKKVIQPVNGTGFNVPDIHALYEQELAKEAAESPVMNPASGQVIAAPPEDTQQDSLQSNPISADPEAAAAPTAPPLETVDVSQISGLYASEEEAALAAATEQAVPQSPQPVTEQNTPPSQPVAPAPTNTINPNDPNNFAL